MFCIARVLVYFPVLMTFSWQNIAGSFALNLLPGPWLASLWKITKFRDGSSQERWVLSVHRLYCAYQDDFHLCELLKGTCVPLSNSRAASSSPCSLESHPGTEAILPVSLIYALWGSLAWGQQVAFLRGGTVLRLFSNASHPLTSWLLRSRLLDECFGL